MNEPKPNIEKRTELEVTLTGSDGVAVVSVRGDFDSRDVVAFRRVCSQAVQENLVDFVIDLSQVESIDGYGLASLVGLLARSKNKDGRVILCGINPDLRARFEATHCDTVFETALTVAKATEKLKGGSKK